MAAPEQIEWLLAGDPAIRWQVLRDLLDAPAEEVAAERARVVDIGWGSRLLSLQGEDGRWAADRGPKGYRGIYSPKWTSTTYTLLLLRRLGVPPGNDGALAGCDALVRHADWTDAAGVRLWNADTSDTCVSALVCSVLEYFDAEATRERERLLEYLLAEQTDDGSWSADKGPMHATIAALEALAIRRERVPSGYVDAAIERGREYLLERQFFRSPETGEVLDPAFRRLSFPPRWHYDVLRGLDHFQATDAPADDRAAAAIALLERKVDEDGRWPLEDHHSGEEHFVVEEPGEPSRWNTLRALRVLEWWREASG
ncbi:hypothetical protein L593_04725 [Salinarchaeum sp. Harcht-Bsk1]|uniref:hypothetical protein n=1 Tax=Salinarchaeum sp. Harcht-Bsk1 TaxID=1333523 RepID=UPI0003422D0E|nr:hypothetical protein [Salinarchaeum sp. Harcht-Bsk1]AGN00894.1 hypothetical protein L593_04725 [Salinarchaeum sp. Harcht-Bsk1]